MIAKIIRKLKLGKAAYNLAKNFVSDCSDLPDTEEAYRLLGTVSPDIGGSAVCTRSMGKPDNLLDIIIPVYNGERYIRACLDSVFAQRTDFPFRVLVIDDGSTDSTPDILREYGMQHENLTVITQPNGGHAAAKNTGLEKSRAEYVFFLDADDLLYEDAVDRLMKCTLETKADIVEGAYDIISEDGQLISKVPHKSGKMNIPNDSTGFACNMLIKTELWDNMQLPVGYWYEDSMMFQLLLPLAKKNGKTAVGIAEASYMYRFNRQGFTQSNKGKPKSMDSVWVTLSLYRDRKQLGLENTQEYYEYILAMLPQTFRRTAGMSTEVHKAVFAVWRDFILREFSGFSSIRPIYQELEKAVKSGDFGRYRLLCKLI